MKYAILFLIALLTLGSSAQSDTLVKPDTSEYVKKQPTSLKAHNFGMVFEGLYSILRMDANAYSAGGKMVTPEAVNTFGARLGVFSIVKHMPIRVGVEFSFINSRIKYPNETVRSSESNIYNLCLEIPVLFSHQFKSNDPLRGYHFSAGPRLIVPMKDFQSEFPQQRSANLNVDIAVGLYRPWKLAKFEAELFYSIGLLNVLQASTSDYRNNAINSLYRDCAGIRMFVR